MYTEYIYPEKSSMNIMFLKNCKQEINGYFGWSLKIH